MRISRNNLRLPSGNLNRLYFQSVAAPKGVIAWFTLAAALHIGLFSLPRAAYHAQPQNIVFLKGDAGEVAIALDLDLPRANASQSQQDHPQQEIKPADTSDLRPPIENDVEAPEHLVARSKSSVAKPPKAKRVVGGPSARKAGTAIAQTACQIVTTQPPYPPGARTLGIEGSVRLRVRVGADGSPRLVEILRSSGRSDFDNASVGTVRREWRFRPARLADGTPVESTLVVAIQFILHS